MNIGKTLTFLLLICLFTSFSPISINLDSFSSLVGKWRGKGYFSINGEKKSFEVTQWVGINNEERVNIYGYVKLEKLKPQDFNRSLFTLKEENKTVIGFYLKENLLVQADFNKNQDNDWHYEFEDDKGFKYRYTWHIENENLWIETSEILIINDWRSYSKVALMKE